jgi:hypothetical protein
MPDARRTRSLACEIKKHTSIVTTGPPEKPGIPRAMVLTAYFVLSPATNSSCHRRWRIWRGETRSGSLSLRQLDTSNGCQDHTALPYALASFVLRAVDRSRAEPALRTRCAPDAAASTASHPAYVTIAIRPCRGTGRRGF